MDTIFLKLKKVVFCDINKVQSLWQTLEKNFKKSKVLFFRINIFSVFYFTGAHTPETVKMEPLLKGELLKIYLLIVYNKIFLSKQYFYNLFLLLIEIINWNPKIKNTTDPITCLTIFI